MSMVETYVLASKARAKLTNEASRQDHDLRKLVHHANLLDNLMEKIQNHKIDTEASLRNYTAFPQEHHVSTVTFVESYADDDSDSDSEDDEDYHYATEIAYSDESDEDYEYDSSDDDDSESDEEEDEHVTWEVNLTRVHSSNFRSLPTIDELSEQELEDLDSEESDENDFDIPEEDQHVLAFQEEEEEDEEETDIVDLKKTPSLNYTSSTEDEDEEEDGHETYTAPHSTNQILNILKYKEMNQSIDEIILEGEDITTQSRSQNTLICA